MPILHIWYYHLTKHKRKHYMNRSSFTGTSPGQIEQKLQTTPQGLTAREASDRLAKYGQNVFKRESKQTAWHLLLGQLRSSLVYLLAVACGLSFLLKDWNDGFVILAILLINTGLGFYQEFKSGKAVEKLQSLVGKEILVKREGKDILIPEKLIVPGDVAILREGDIIPADIRLISVNDFAVNESQLTGESIAVIKTTAGDDSAVYAGSTVEQGEAVGYVYATGSSTELGKIAHLSGSTRRVTQFEKSLETFSNFLVRVTFLTLGSIFVLKLILVHNVSHVGDLLIFVIALSIAVVPEAMPVIVTVTLSRGSLRLAKQHVIAKTLTAVEDLGNINVLCSDKTGTLTQNKQSVTKLISDDEALFQRLAMASLETTDEKRKKRQSSFDQAFLNYVSASIQTEAQGYKRLEELPFDPAARRRRVVYAYNDSTYLVEIGSVETLLALTKDSRTSQYLEIIKEDGAMGLRHLGIAYKKISLATDLKFDILKHETGLKFAGFVALDDPLRPTASHTIELAEKLGVAIKILSGDSKEVTGYVASQVGLLRSDQAVYTGEELDKLSDLQLGDIVIRNSAFARLNPEQKYRIISVLKRQGNVVGYQGDGINDAPALKLADVAIAVNNASDVARESADILLLRSDLNVIINGIRYGREIFANINKYIRYTFVGNWGNLFALAALYLLNTGLPILAVQVLLLSLLGDIPCLTIAGDNVDSQELQRPSVYNIHSLMFISMLLGIVTAVFEISFAAIMRNAPSAAEQTALYLFLSVTQLIVIFSVRNKDHFWRAPSMSAAMKIAFALTAIITVGVVYLSTSQKIFSFVSLSWGVIGVVVGMTLLFFMALDTVKVWFYNTGVGEA
jgi:Mg2+-importing ATPase